jgi:hypothetical protein
MAVAINTKGNLTPANPWRWAACGCILAFLFCPALLRAQDATETVGRIEGADLAVKGRVSVAFENNRSTTMLTSGSEVSVRTGQARILLTEGGEIHICAPAHLTVLKSGGAITLALDSGRVRLRLPDSSPVTVYTPVVVATPIAIAGHPRDATVGVESGGSMCVFARGGALRLDEQLSGQTVVVPQGGEMAMPNGQLDAIAVARDGCRCEFAQPSQDLLARAEPVSAPRPPEYSVPAKPSGEKSSEAGASAEPKPAPPSAPASPVLPPPRAEAGAAPTAPPATEAPTWRVVMPPLTFDANAPALRPEPNPEMILLIRQVRVEPELVWTGRVEESESHNRTTTAKAEKSHKKKGGFFAWLKRIFGGGRKNARAPAQAAAARAQSRGPIAAPPGPAYIPS